MEGKMVTIDGNEAAAYAGFHLSEVIAIYPITPSSGMGELSDEWAAQGKKNVWGTIPNVMEMQSEGGAAGAVHGSVQAGALSTTFTASQGLLLMIPNMYKIAGELTPAVFHVSARSVACQALSIFGDHSDVMATRQTGFALLASGSVQESLDLAIISHSATLASRIPFLHFFDGFRTSHEIMKVHPVSPEIMRQMINEEHVLAHRNRGLTPDKPVLRGTAQNPDVFFQARETVNAYYDKTPALVQEAMDKYAGLTGRQYHLFDYVGHDAPEKLIVMMGSGAETAHETVDYLTKNNSEKVGLVKVRLYRPFDTKAFVNAVPASVKQIAVLDRTKEPGAIGEPLYQDVVTALSEIDAERASKISVIGGRYGLSSKEFTPAMVKGVLDELDKDTPRRHVTVGINDDVTHTSVAYDNNFSTEDENSFRGIFIGLGSDGTVSANKNSIKIIGEQTDNFAQGFFVYDSKKSGSVTKSFLRFGKNPIRSTYLTRRANFVACHQFSFLEKFDVLEQAEKGATFLLNSPYGKDEVWDKLPRVLQQEIIDKEVKFYVIDAYKVAEETKMGIRINTIMQTCFFAIADILPQQEAIQKIKDAIEKTFGRKGAEVVQMNYNAVDQAVANLHQVDVPSEATSKIEMPPVVAAEAPQFVQEVTSIIMEGKGDDLPVSALPDDGTYPLTTTKWEKRNVAMSIPVWEPDLCIQCGKCSLVCPHAVIRSKVYDTKLLDDAPSAFKHTTPKGKEWPENYSYTLQVAPEDCTGCEVCVQVCPAKSKTEEGKKAINMAPQMPIRETERENWSFFDEIPNYDRTKLKIHTVKGSQMLEPLFEFSGACAGCGETPYLKLATQLFGDRMMIANATGCSSIYGGNLPTVPFAENADGRGPSWSNSLFEDNAEFGLGFRLAVNKKAEHARELVLQLKDKLNNELVSGILEAQQVDEADIFEQRKRVIELKETLKGQDSSEARQLLSLADYLVKKSVWLVGGDGWAYDIGYGGLDHVLASGHNVNALVLDTEVYSNTGGQMSKATPIGAIAKFAAAGKPALRKNLGLLSMSYGNIYVASIALGASDTQTIKAFIEAEQYEGPSLIIAYSHCIAHGYDLRSGLNQQKLAVASGYWPLFRYDPRRAEKGENPFQLDSKPPSIPLTEYIYNENRYRMLTKANPDRAKMLAEKAQAYVNRTWDYINAYRDMGVTQNSEGPAAFN